MDVFSTKASRAEDGIGLPREPGRKLEDPPRLHGSFGISENESGEKPGKKLNPGRRIDVPVDLALKFRAWSRNPLAHDAQSNSQIREASRPLALWRQIDGEYCVASKEEPGPPFAVFGVVFRSEPGALGEGLKLAKAEFALHPKSAETAIHHHPELATRVLAGQFAELLDYIGRGRKKCPGRGGLERPHNNWEQRKSFLCCSQYFRGKFYLRRRRCDRREESRSYQCECGRRRRRLFGPVKLVGLIGLIRLIGVIAVETVILLVEESIEEFHVCVLSWRAACFRVQGVEASFGCELRMRASGASVRCEHGGGSRGAKTATDKGELSGVLALTGT